MQLGISQINLPEDSEKVAGGTQNSPLPGSPEGKGFVVTQIWQSQYACEQDPPQTT